MAFLFAVEEQNLEVKKLKIHRESMDFENAALNCEKGRGSGLFVIDSDGALQAVHDQLRTIFRFFSSTLDKQFWVKGVDGDFQVNTFFWIHKAINCAIVCYRI